MKIKLIGNDILVESILGLFTIFIIVFMVSGLVLITILPINNYHHTMGQIEFRRQYKVASPNEGIVTRVYAENYSDVNISQPIIRYRSEYDTREVEALNVRLRFLNNELATLERLFRIGSVNRPEVERKRLEIQEVMTRKRNLEKNTVDSPVEGKVYFRSLPEYLKGDFIERGEVIAFIYTDEEKHVRISVPNTYADRFKVGGDVLFKYKDPVNFKIQKLEGVIYKTFINKKQNTIELYCDITEGKDNLDLFQPFTMINAAILINSTSILQDMFGIDPYPVFKRFIVQSRWYQKLKDAL